MSVTELVTDGPLLLAAPVAAAAGLLSFFSPCVLPLVPGYLSYVTGLSGAELEGESRPRRASAGPAKAAAAELAPAEPAGGAAAMPAGTVLVAVGAGSAGSGELAAAGHGDRPPTGGAQRGGAQPGALPAGRAAGSAWRGLGRLRRVGRVTVGTGLFVLGFTAVFVLYGVAVGGLGTWLKIHSAGVAQVMGALTIVMGLLFAGVFSRFSWANREFRFHRLPAPGLLGAPVLGAMFGLGWTPCLGPTLAAVLGLSLQSATAGRGAFLSAVYCLGLGVPFIVVGVAFRRAAGALRAVRAHARLLTMAGGALLVAVGVLQVTGQWADLVTTLRPYAPGFVETPL
ncbi:cytochrome c biogenesis protein CcdA [Frankia sp. CNm7]|uniref:Cytochrome c biogenesis protein CcdA n=1 Tax=Frankia nepalensis TaxID=1836974 RepID=A0A937RRI7_9ACTN|nr:cytochrome c biogenesis CcdA family protein [Frankia nepalensis]MBL7496037.1 cytochrome c biogenesis protein CcdA [Frankia nepalensis]MBL7511842.1 cytochrome c biogenesis protein CcdA [Frankia nepalensis]MBL7517213.1 cytochrome c biogenesis protein CcdA [Frankia nepalensis]MBL7630641.1 cytochrome c biogenesis protein CcdA [Frankia nepalensis]